MAERKIKAVLTQTTAVSEEEAGRLNLGFDLKVTEDQDGKAQKFMDCELTYYNVSEGAASDLGDAFAVMMQELGADGITATDIQPGGLQFDLTREQLLILEKEVIELFGELNDYGAEEAEKKGHPLGKLKAKKDRPKKPKLRKR